MNQVKVGTFLKQLRKENNLTQEQIADKFGVSQRSVSRWENGNTLPDISLLVELAELFKVSIPELINGERKDETMDKEVKEVAMSMSDYATYEKTGILNELKVLGLIEFGLILIYAVLNLTNNFGVGLVEPYETLLMLFEAALFSITVIIPLYCTSLLGQIRQSKYGKIHKPFIIIASIILGICITILLRTII